MKKETPVKEWPDITNGILSFWGKFFLIPLVCLGSLVCLCGNAFIGMLLIFGAVVVFLLVALLLLLFKPVLVKKYPIHTKQLRPVSILVDILGEAPREEFVMTTGEYRVSAEMPRGNMTPLQKLAVDRCSGDLEAAWHYLLTYKNEAVTAYLKQATPREKEACASCSRVRADARSPEEDARLMDQAVVSAHLSSLGMTKEQVLSSKRDPFTPKFLKWTGISLTGGAMIGLAAGLGYRFIRNERVVDISIVLLILGTIIAVFKAIPVLIDVIWFRKTKRLLKKG